MALKIKIVMQCLGCHSMFSFENDEHEYLDKTGIVELITNANCPTCADQYEIQVPCIEINETKE